MASIEPTQRTQRDSFLALARGAARMQIAACSALATSFAGWARAADRLAQDVGDELLRRVENESDSTELVAGLTKATSSYLRDIATLPRIATDHFDARLARVPTDT